MEKQLEELKRYLSDKVENNFSRNTKFITVTSGKGGVGKTNFIVNFAYILANHYRKKVLLIDADIGLGNVHILLKIPLVKSLKEVLNGKKIEDNIVNIKNFDVLPGFSGFDSLKEIEQSKIDRLIYDIDKLSNNYDYVLIDTSAGIGDDVVSFINASDKTYLITTPEPTAITDAYALIKTMVKIYGYKNFHLVVNMCKNIDEGEEVYKNLNSSTQRFLSTSLENAGFLYNSENLKRSVIEREVMIERFPSDQYSKNLVEIAKREINGGIAYREKESFWKKFLSFFNK